MQGFPPRKRKILNSILCCLAAIPNYGNASYKECANLNKKHTDEQKETVEAIEDVCYATETFAVTALSATTIRTEQDNFEPALEPVTLDLKDPCRSASTYEENLNFDCCIQAVSSNCTCGASRGECNCQETHQQGLKPVDFDTSVFTSERGPEGCQKNPAADELLHLKRCRGVLQTILPETAEADSLLNSVASCGSTALSQVAYASDDRQDGEATFATSCREKLGQLEKEKAASSENSVDGFVGSTLHAILWEEVFQLFDKDRNGHISRDELGRVFRALDLDPSQKELDQALKELDKDGNGIIELDDFKMYLKKVKRSSYDERKQEMMQAFSLLDKNNDKFIDAKELSQVLTSLGEVLSEAEINAMIQVADTNKDGKIDYEGE
uniref:EF-hand domain-containing protein n=1 Tax=Biomphalaria glabrata TaxID=6526 RepID=A0A2C9LQT5_BIOGL